MKIIIYAIAIIVTAICVPGLIVKHTFLYLRCRWQWYHIRHHKYIREMKKFFTECKPEPKQFCKKHKLYKHDICEIKNAMIYNPIEEQIVTCNLDCASCEHCEIQTEEIKNAG